MAMKKRNSKEVLLAKGLDILGDKGIEGLTIDTLCVELGVTKGSFYHHFGSRGLFHAALLEYWLDVSTERKKALADEKGTPEERYARIVEAAAALPHGLEKAVRAWAMRDPLVAEYQARVDASRLDYLEGLLKELLDDPAQARDMARIVLSTMIGLRHLFPPMIGEARRETMGMLHALMGLQLPSAT